MHGQAEIITDERMLIARIFSYLKYAMSDKPVDRGK
jgi:hypothetical protein